MLRQLGMTAVLAVTSLSIVSPPPATASETSGLLEQWIALLETERSVVTELAQQPVTRVDSGYALSVGSAGPRVGQLIARLTELDYLEEGDEEGVSATAFDEAVEEAVSAFQQDRGLFVDGIVGPQTVAELNRTHEETLTALHWTIDRARELHALAPDMFLLVNVPSQTATLVRDGDIIMDMRAAVGRPTRSTPIIEDRITSITFNPRWVVPPTIMREDVLPRLRSEGATGVSESTVYLDGDQVDPTTVDWSEVQPWQIFIRQSAGNHNALGRYLFNLTNDQNIFIHHTNAPSVFQSANRAISSGCVRVEDARALAEYLMAENGFDPTELDRHLVHTRLHTLTLEQELPVFITYWTAVPESDDRVVYHRDIYSMTDGYMPMERITVSDVADQLRDDVGLDVQTP